MSIAIFVESNPRFPGYRREFMIVPGIPERGEDVPQVWYRLTDGSKGKTAKWHQHHGDVEDAATVAKATSSEQVVRVVGIGITKSNVVEFVRDGWSGAVATRAIGSTTTDPHGYDLVHDALPDLFRRLAEGDSSLTAIVDGGMWGAIEGTMNVAPKTSAPEPTPPVAPAVPTPGVTPVVPDTTPVVGSNPSIPDGVPTATVVDDVIDDNTDANGEVNVAAAAQALMEVPVNGQQVRRFVPFDGKSLLISPSVARKYVHRDVHGVRDFDIFDAALRANENVLVEGPTGAGKTMGVRAWAAERGIMLARVNGDGGMNLHMTLGMRDIDEQGTFWVDGSVAHVCRHGGGLLFDEINFWPPKMAAAMYPLFDADRAIRLLDNNGEVIRVHKNTLIVATMNPSGSYSGTQELNHALRNRFQHFLAWDYDTQAERNLGILPAVAALAKELRAKEASDTISTPTPTNALMTFQDHVGRFGWDYATNNFVNRYDETERSAIRMVIDTESDSLKRAFGLSSFA